MIRLVTERVVGVLIVTVGVMVILVVGETVVVVTEV